LALPLPLPLLLECIAAAAGDTAAVVVAFVVGIRGETSVAPLLVPLMLLVLLLLLA
jgi:hypothetical protein